MLMTSKRRTAVMVVPFSLKSPQPRFEDDDRFVDKEREGMVSDVRRRHSKSYISE